MGSISEWQKLFPNAAEQNNLGSRISYIGSIHAEPKDDLPAPNQRASASPET